MAASAGGETVKAPGNLVISAYVTCPDITLTVTPDLKLPGSGRLIHVDLAEGKRRLGGSALAQVSNWESLQRLTPLQQPACKRLEPSLGSGPGPAQTQVSDWVASELFSEQGSAQLVMNLSLMLAAGRLWLRAGKPLGSWSKSSACVAAHSQPSA